MKKTLNCISISTQYSVMAYTEKFRYCNWFLGGETKIIPDKKKILSHGNQSLSYKQKQQMRGQHPKTNQKPNGINIGFPKAARHSIL